MNKLFSRLLPTNEEERYFFIKRTVGITIIVLLIVMAIIVFYIAESQKHLDTPTTYSYTVPKNGDVVSGIDALTTLKVFDDLGLKASIVDKKGENISAPNPTSKFNTERDEGGIIFRIK
ncbi:hypothetical protein ACPV3A_29655 [Paenibacillus sp. Dod16]|uniref:hypothetical protein n=1 Tax=Paenibacillus sp. Dod16 TaxID=3416392 RepID=UPI003CFA8551